MLLGDLVRKGADYLEKSGVEQSLREAKYILSDILGEDFIYLVTNEKEPTSLKIKEAFFSYIEQRASRKPLSKIRGRRFFYGYEFLISCKTLDPRPESETIIEAVLKNVDKKDELNILDLGTGSGCLILTLLSELRNAKGMGVDVCPDALSIAKKNAAKLGVEERVHFLQSNWMKEVNKNKKFDVIVSNPPYIEEDMIDALEPEVRLNDPRIALSGGKDGLQCYDQIIKELSQSLSKGAKIFFEIGAGQEDKILYMMKREGYLCKRKFYDLSNHARCLELKKSLC